MTVFWGQATDIIAISTKTKIPHPPDQRKGVFGLTFWATRHRMIHGR